MVAPPTGPHEVHYSNKYFNTDPLQSEINHKRFLTTKFTAWKYEKEFRFISPRMGSHLFPKKRLKMIVFGLRTTSGLRDSIEKIIRNDSDYGVEFKQIKLAQDRFELELKANN